MRPSRETIIEQFRACASKLGKTPGRKLFCDITGFKQGDINYYWPNQAALARDAGLLPNQANTATPIEQLYESYARICLHLKKVPTSIEISIAGRELYSKTFKNVFSNRFGTLAAFQQQFKEWLEAGPEQFVQILSFPGWEARGWGVPKQAMPKQKQVSTSPLPNLVFHPFLPASLQYLDVLARGQKPWAHFDDNVNTAFERRCADAFKCLGFEVRQLGQGHGRAADSLALAHQERFAVIIDAKVRANGYTLGTDDRKFLEYSKTHAAQINQLGIDKIYFVVIGSSFRHQDLEKLTKYLADSPLRSVTLLTARALMRIVEESIAERHRFRLASIDQLLFGNKVVDQ